MQEEINVTSAATLKGIETSPDPQWKLNGSTLVSDFQI